jgi:hypothetical protein
MQAVYYYLPERPLLRVQRGRPVLTLTLVLSRRPAADEESIHPLIERGILAFDVELAPPPAALAELQRTRPAEYRALFLRDSAIRLRAESGEILSTMAVSGTDARGALSATLDRDQALGALAAIDGGASGLAVEASIGFNASESDTTVRLRGSWAEVHDWLAARVPGDGRFTTAELRNGFADMVASDVIRVSIVAAGREQVVRTTDAAEFDAFRSMAFVVLDRESAPLAEGDGAATYSLRRKPSPLFLLDASQTIATAAMRTEIVRAPLEDVLGGSLDGQDREEFIHLVAPDGAANGGGAAPVPRRVRSSRRGPPSNGSARNGHPFIATSGHVTALASMLRPASVAYRPHDLLAGQASHVAWLDDAQLVSQQPPQFRHLPTVVDPAAPLWPDREDGGTFWYAPAFELVAPDPAGDPEASPFLFTSRTLGATASGVPALQATIRCTLRPTMRADTQAALAARGNPPAQAVVLSALSVSLELPFVDDRDGQTKMETLAMGIAAEDDGRIVASVDLLNDWVRLAYGALSQPGFQSRPASVRTVYTLEAYVPVQPGRIDVAWGGKVALTHVNYSAVAPADRATPYLNAADATYHYADGELRLRREAPHSAPRSAPRRAGATAVATRPLNGAAAHVVAPVLAIRPELSLSPIIAGLLAETEYAVQSLIRSESADALFPCATLGTLYRETQPQGPVSIGCRDALALGRTTYKQYEELVELRHERYRVHRSLQQPGQFLVVPAYYRIGRYAHTEGTRAYRPILYLYSVLDAEVATNSRVVLHATLQPDIPVYVRRDLEVRLARYASTPVLVYPTEILASPESVLLVDSGIEEEPRVVQFPDSLQVAIATDVVGARLLRTRLETDTIAGSATWTLADGTVLSSALSLELGGITGPWESGPLEITPTSTGARLTNRTEGAVSVSDALLYDASGAGPRIPVEATLDPGAFADVAFTPGDGELVPVYTIPAGTLATLSEVRSFIEEIHTNVIFLDLIDHAQHDLQSLAIQARLDGVDGTYDVPWTNGVGTLDILLPLTSQLDERTLHYQVSKTTTAGDVSTTPSLEWDLAAGNVISLTWPLIQ